MSDTIVICLVCLWGVSGLSFFLYTLGGEYKWSLRSFAAESRRTALLQALGESVDECIIERDWPGMFVEFDQMVKEERRPVDKSNLTKLSVVVDICFSALGCMLFGPAVWFTLTD